MFTQTTQLVSKTITQKREESANLLKEYMSTLHKTLGESKIGGNYQIESKGFPKLVRTPYSKSLKIDKNSAFGPVLVYFSGGGTSQYFKYLFSGDGFFSVTGGQIGRGLMQEYGFCAKDEKALDVLLMKLENLKQNGWKMQTQTSSEQIQNGEIKKTQTDEASKEVKVSSVTAAPLPKTKEEEQHDLWAAKLMNDINAVDRSLESMTIFKQPNFFQSKKEKLYAEKIKLFEGLSAYKGTDEKIVKFISDTARVVYMLKGISELGRVSRSV